MIKIQLSFIPYLLLLATLLLAPCNSLLAQGEDLSLPGDEKPVIVNTGGEAAADTESGATQEKESLLDQILNGGWFMIPLFILLFAVIALSVYLLLDLRRGNFSPPGLFQTLNERAEAGDLAGIAESAKSSGTCLGQVMNGACVYIHDRGNHVLDGDSIFDLMADTSQEFNRKRVNLLTYLSVIAQAAPMVGLLGTVSGMIKAFRTLNQKGNGDSGQLAGNISEALLTTAGGLIVALPAIFMFYFLRNKMIGLVAQVDKECYRVLNSLRNKVIGIGNSSSGGAPPSGGGGGGNVPTAPPPQPHPPVEPVPQQPAPQPPPQPVSTPPPPSPEPQPITPQHPAGPQPISPNHPTPSQHPLAD